MKCCKFLAPCAVSVLMTGCATMPYQDTFDCPQMEGGRCASVVEAYADAAGQELPEKAPKESQAAKKETVDKKSDADAVPAPRAEADLRREALRLELMERHARGAENGSPAVLMPPVVMEATVLPYQTDFSALAGERTLWITVEDAAWVWPDRFGDKTDRPDIGATFTSEE